MIVSLIALGSLFFTGKTFSETFELNPMILNNIKPQQQKSEPQPIKNVEQQSSPQIPQIKNSGETPVKSTTYQVIYLK